MQNLVHEYRVVERNNERCERRKNNEEVYSIVTNSVAEWILSDGRCIEQPLADGGVKHVKQLSVSRSSGAFPTALSPTVFFPFTFCPRILLPGFFSRSFPP